MQSRCYPFKYDLLNKLEMLSLVTSIVSCLAGWYFLTVEQYVVGDAVVAAICGVFNGYFLGYWLLNYI